MAAAARLFFVYLGFEEIGNLASLRPKLEVGNALHNIVVATIGNLVGGSVMVGAVYWFVYLRRRV